MSIQIDDFVEAVLVMREAQRKYFKSRVMRDLFESKCAERKVDNMLSEHIDAQQYLIAKGSNPPEND